MLTREVQTASGSARLFDGRRPDEDSSDPPTKAIMKQSRQGIARGDPSCDIPVSCPFSG